MRIIIDDDVWADAWADWDDSCSDGHWRTAKPTWDRHTKIVRDRVVAAVGMPVESVQVIEDLQETSRLG